MTTLVREENGKEIKVKRYYHKVLEAKLVPAENIVISLDTEFIENESEEVSKNDCEINASKRLLERLKRDYPKLPVCLQGDALYAAESIMKICNKNHWKLYPDAKGKPPESPGGKLWIYTVRRR